MEEGSRMPLSAKEKHAYLIMAHHNFKQLRTLLSLLDDERNDIYLHVDKKTKNYPVDTLKLTHAKLYLVKPISVSWGGDSVVKCEMLLFKAAAPKHYMYYHTLSGVDLPLKTQDEIHQFFERNAGKNFIDYDEEANKARRFLCRIRQYRFFQNIVGRKRSVCMRALRFIDILSMKLQALVGIKRKEMIPLYKGETWVSLTDDMVQHLLASEKLIKKQFYHAMCVDELFMQSIAKASPYADTIVENDFRAIDWERGSPYTYRKEDVPQLLASEDLFARKFDMQVDEEAITLIASKLANASNCS